MVEFHHLDDVKPTNLAPKSPPIGDENVYIPPNATLTHRALFMDYKEIMVVNLP